MSDEERAERVRNYYRQRDERLRQGPSSEDIWEARREEDILVEGEEARRNGGLQVVFGGLKELEEELARRRKNM